MPFVDVGVAVAGSGARQCMGVALPFGPTRGCRVIGQENRGRRRFSRPLGSSAVAFPGPPVFLGPVARTSCGSTAVRKRRICSWRSLMAVCIPVRTAARECEGEGKGGVVRVVIGGGGL